MLAVPRLCMQPGIGGRQHALRRRLYRPGFRRAEIVVQKSFDRGFAGDVADIAAADAVGQRDGDRPWNSTAVRSECKRRENPGWFACAPCRNVARSISAVAGHWRHGWGASPLQARLPCESNQAAMRVGAADVALRRGPDVRGIQVRPVKARPPTRLPSTVGNLIPDEVIHDRKVSRGASALTETGTCSRRNARTPCRRTPGSASTSR